MCNTVPCRAEQQRNQALENAEKLKEAFKDYKATISIKLKKVQISIDLTNRLIFNCTLISEMRFDLRF